MSFFYTSGPLENSEVQDCLSPDLDCETRVALCKSLRYKSPPGTFNAFCSKELLAPCLAEFLKTTDLVHIKSNLSQFENGYGDFLNETKWEDALRLFGEKSQLLRESVEWRQKYPTPFEVQFIVGNDDDDDAIKSRFEQCLPNADTFDVSDIIRLNEVKPNLDLHSTLFNTTIQYARSFNSQDVIKLWRANLDDKAQALFERTLEFAKFKPGDVIKMYTRDREDENALLKTQAAQLFDATLRFANEFRPGDIIRLAENGLLDQAKKLFDATLKNANEFDPEVVRELFAARLEDRAKILFEKTRENAKEEDRQRHRDYFARLPALQDLAPFFAPQASKTP